MKSSLDSLVLKKNTHHESSQKTYFNCHQQLKYGLKRAVIYSDLSLLDSCVCVW